tara:strand:+ start:167 stop:295 length:129 start_codon:yes stop_codon:yes gene_type:complete
MYLTSEDIKDLEKSITNKKSAEIIKLMIFSTVVGFISLLTIY